MGISSMADYSHIDFTDLQSVMSEVISAEVSGTVLSSNFYTQAVDGLSAMPPASEYHLFGSGGNSGSLINDLDLDGAGRYTHIQSTDVGKFLAYGSTGNALVNTLSSGQSINGFTSIGDVLNGATTNSLWGRHH